MTASYIYSLYIYYRNYPLLYFSSISRLWEYILGSLLTQISSSVYPEKILLCIIILIFCDNHLAKYTPISSIIPLTFSLFILLNNNFNDNILNLFLLNHLGNIAYPFYIFHYIILFNATNISYKNTIYLLIKITLIVYLVSVSFNNTFNRNFIKAEIVIIIYIFSFISIIYICKILICRNNDKQIAFSKVKYTLY